MDFIKLVVEVGGAQYASDVKSQLRYLHPSKVIYEELPENGRVIKTEHHPVSGGMPAWAYVFYIKARD